MQDASLLRFLVDMRGVDADDRQVKSSRSLFDSMKKQHAILRGLSEGTSALYIYAMMHVGFVFGQLSTILPFEFYLFITLLNS